MLDKLTKEELEYAKNEIKRLYTISNEELSEKVKNESKLDNYNSLSMTDSYISHIISKIIYSRSIKVTNQILKAKFESHRRMSEKSYYYANKNFYK